MRNTFAALAVAAAACCLAPPKANATVTTTTTSVSCTAPGGGFTCSVPFPFTNATDLIVTLNGALQTIGTNYTVYGAGLPSGGSVTMVGSVTATTAMTVTRLPPFLQLFNARNQGRFLPASYEAAFDALEFQIQALSAGICVGQIGSFPVSATSPIIGNGTNSSPLHLDFTVANTFTATQTFAPSSGNVSGVVSSGHGTGAGVAGTGSSTGSAGVTGTGTNAGVSGAAFPGVVGTGAFGINVTGAPGGSFTGGAGTTTGGPGVLAIGGGPGGDGIDATGNGTGVGIAGTGGSTGAIGGNFTASSSGGSPNNIGVRGVGAGTSAGALGQGGATGPGVSGLGGATSGPGGIFQPGTTSGPASADINLVPISAPPSSPISGDVWVTTTNMGARVNGATYVLAPLKAGACTLGTSCAAISLPISMVCTCADTTAANACKASAPGTSVTFTGTGTDALNYTCIAPQ